MNHYRCATRCALLAVTSLLCGAMPSLAAAAPAVPGAESQVVDFPAGEYCTFPIELSFLDGTKLHSDSSSVYSTGPLSLTATNLDSGKARTFNASGPTFRDGTLTGTALIGQPASRDAGPPFLIINRGRVTFNSDNTIRTITGSQIDVCGALS